MLDIKYIREHKDEVIKRLNTRPADYTEQVENLYNYDVEYRKAIVKVENLKAKSNQTSKLIGEYKRQGKDTKEIFDSIATLKTEIQELNDEMIDLQNKIKDILDVLPNLPKEDVVIGKDETENMVMRTVGTPTTFSFTPKSHYDIGTNLDILDFDRAGKVSGARFVIYKGLGARLERSLIAFMMDLHSSRGYTECMPPYMINAQSMYGTGQFPKFKEDAFAVNDDRGLYLNPTAEVPTINMYRDEIIDGSKLPIKYCSYTTAFRKEAGSAGKDTHGIIRQHQFNKVELINFVYKEDGYKALEELTNEAEEVLKQLKLPYHVVELCTGDMGFGSAKTYDIEVWIPSENRYREISSCSNDEDFQARRANIRVRRSPGAPLEFPHILNGSGLAVGRTLVAILENYQQEDGSVIVPEALRKYMGVDIIK
ncbi:serine--tRNA ligase [bacterium]|nr:serine--tRNA ligase [bacterium]